MEMVLFVVPPIATKLWFRYQVKGRDGGRNDAVRRALADVIKRAASVLAAEVLTEETPKVGTRLIRSDSEK
jgi:hypothetical protein